MGITTKFTLPCGRITTIDTEDFEIKQVFPHWRWSGGYVKISRYIKTEYGRAKEEYYLHRFLLRYKEHPALQVDHINRDKLDNRKSNLRWLTRSDNCRNTAVKKYKLGASKYRGVRSREDRNKKNPWMAYITAPLGEKKRQIHLGYFKTERAAAFAYTKKFKELFGSL